MQRLYSGKTDKIYGVSYSVKWKQLPRRETIHLPTHFPYFCGVFFHITGAAQ